MPRKTEDVVSEIKLRAVEELPLKAEKVDISRFLIRKYPHKYTTGPFMLPQNTHSLNWNLLNDDSTQQKVRVTVFKCWIGAPKTVEPPGPLVITLDSGESSHNANQATGGFCYEIQVECDSKLVFPSVEAWPGSIGDVIPGTQIRAAEFIREMS
jgi:hypothetical protein